MWISKSLKALACNFSVHYTDENIGHESDAIEDAM